MEIFFDRYCFGMNISSHIFCSFKIIGKILMLPRYIKMAIPAIYHRREEMFIKGKLYKTAFRSAMLVFVASALTACAFGQKITYSHTMADVDASGTKSIALATWDQRPYVVTGNKTPTFVGLSRGGYGNPFDVNTQSGAPLADDISQSLSQSLDSRGFKTVVVRSQATESHHAIVDALRDANKERAVLVTLKEWKTDTYMRTKLLYDVKVDVFGSDGNELASQTFTTESKIGDVGAAFKHAIEEWFSAPKIVEALK